MFIAKNTRAHALAHRKARTPNPAFPVSHRYPLGRRSHQLQAYAVGQQPTSGLKRKVIQADASIEGIPLQEGYDAAANSLYWETRPVPVIARLITIGIEFGVWFVASRFKKEATAALLRDVLVKLGPAFVKIGQALSSRPDVLPPEWIQEFELLQDRIPAFSNQDAFAVLESELGGSLFDIFTTISPDPIAAASLGQVYRARLRAGGKDVAVKVQRPGVAQQIALDVYILRKLAGIVRKAGKFNTDLPTLVDEWATSLFRELDYRQEAANAIKFKQLYEHLPRVYVPIIYLDYTSSKILTMEWVDGERLRSASAATAVIDEFSSAAATPPTATAASRATYVATAGRPRGSEDDLELVEVGVRCSLEQMLEEGFYHADPHPGNLLKMRDGRLCYLDFGMMGQIGQPVRQALMQATLHMVNREYEALSQDFVALGFLPAGSDKTQVVPALTGIFQEALQNGVSGLSFGALSANLGRTMYQYKFRIPAYYTLLVRSLSVLEGIALASDPNYKVLGKAYPWVARRLLTDRTPEIRSTLKALLYKQGKFQFASLESLLRQAAKSPARLTRPQIPETTTSTSVTTSLKPSEETGLALLLSEEGAFVRGILIDELAKGVDAAWRLTIDHTVHPSDFSPSPSSSSSSPSSSSRDGVGSGASSVPGQGGLRSGDGYGRGGVGGFEGLNLLGWVRTAAVAPLAWLPRVSEPDDQEQVDGIVKFTAAVSDLVGAQELLHSTTEPSSPLLPGPLGSFIPANPQHSPTALLHSARQLTSFLQWLVAEINTLSPEARREALNIPVQLANRLSSRVAARTLRTLLSINESPSSFQGQQEGW